MTHADTDIGLRGRARRREAIADHGIHALRGLEPVAREIDIGALGQQIMQARRKLVPVVPFEMRVLVAADRAKRGGDLPVSVRT